MDNKKETEKDLKQSPNHDLSLDPNLDPNLGLNLSTEPEAPESETAEESKENPQLLEALKKENKELKEQLVRSLADYQNLTKRVQRERKELSLYAAEPVVRSIAPTLENFYYALSSAEKILSEQKAEVLNSFQVIYHSFFKSLEQIGILEIKPSPGEEFDPNLHEAIASVKSEQEYPANSIEQVLRPGILLHKKVIKLAQVTVSKGSEKEEEEKEEEEKEKEREEEREKVEEITNQDNK